MPARSRAWRCISSAATSSESPSARQTEDALRDDVPLDLGRPAHDGLGARVEVAAPPRLVEHRSRPEDVHRELLQPLIGLAPEDLLYRALDAGLPGAEKPREAPVSDQTEQLDLDVGLRETLPEDGVCERDLP